MARRSRRSPECRPVMSGIRFTNFAAEDDVSLRATGRVTKATVSSHCSQSADDEESGKGTGFPHSNLILLRPDDSLLRLRHRAYSLIQEPVAWRIPAHAAIARPAL